jgi:hypothetical protein
VTVPRPRPFLENLGDWCDWLPRRGSLPLLLPGTLEFEMSAFFAAFSAFWSEMMTPEFWGEEAPAA